MSQTETVTGSLWGLWGVAWGHFHALQRAASCPKALPVTCPVCLVLEQ